VKKELGLTPPEEKPNDLFRRALKMSPYVPEGRETFLALVPDRFKEEKSK
jgi:hypothetical protein